MPNSADSSPTIALSQRDRSFIDCDPTTILLYFEHNIDAEKLYRALREVCRALPIFSSAIVHEEKGPCLQYRPNYFAFSACEHRDIDFAAMIAQPNISMRRFDRLIKNVPSRLESPVLNVQLTHLARGSLIATSLSHTLADGDTFKFFMAALQCAMLGQRIPPFSQQRALQRPASSADSVKNGNSPQLQTSPQTREGFYSFFKISFQKLRSLVPERVVADEHLTKHDLLTAFLLRQYALHLAPNVDNINIRVPVNLRPICDQVDDLYIGNASLDSTFSLPRSFLVDGSMQDLAIHIHNAIRTLKNSHTLRDLVRLRRDGIDFDELFRHVQIPEYQIESDIPISNIGSIQIEKVTNFGQGAARHLSIFPMGQKIFLTHYSENMCHVNFISHVPMPPLTETVSLAA